VNGRVKEVYVSEGEYVEVDSVLMEIEMAEDGEGED
jgi:biotin carboxyl carrier protein